MVPQQLAKGDRGQIVEECTVEPMAAVLGYTPSMAWRTGTGFVAWRIRA